MVFKFELGMYYLYEMLVFFVIFVVMIFVEFILIYIGFGVFSCVIVFCIVIKDRKVRVLLLLFEFIVLRKVDIREYSLMDVE